ncbi:MAG: TerB family tellurite resistance protein [Planctomycetes bacterium]|nr:TerB family tellurite resistance protein [Planctomycetota bacterium]
MNPLTVTKLILLGRLLAGIGLMTLGFWLSRGFGALVGVPLAFLGMTKAIAEVGRLLRVHDLERSFGPRRGEGPRRAGELDVSSAAEAIARILYAIAEIDGPASAAERVAAIRLVVENFPEPQLAEAMNRWELGRVDAATLRELLRAVRRALDDQNRMRFFRWCTRVALADERFNADEHEVLQTVARELGLAAEVARHLFHDEKGRILAERASGGGGQRSQGSPHSSPARRSEALSVLGLDDGASEEDIRRRHRELVKVHHPDANRHLGAAELAASTERFQRIQKAYEVLTAAE